MVRPARWTHSPRPTQESSSTLRPRCPPCTARACCSSKAPRAARRKVSTRPSQDKQRSAKREPCFGSVSSQRLSEGHRVASSLMFTFSPALIGGFHFFNLYCKSLFFTISPSSHTFLTVLCGIKAPLCKKAPVTKRIPLWVTIFHTL